MKRPLTILIILLVLLTFGAYMITFQVKYNEVAVLTTFGSAVEPERDPDTGELLVTADGAPVNPGSLYLEPGLYFKWPWPIQKADTYPKTIQVIEDQIEEFQTNDDISVILKTFVAWRIEDPYAFFRTVNSIGEGANRIEDLTKELRGIVSAYDFDQLVNPDPEQLKLAEIEQRVAEELDARLKRANYGIQIERVGITRLVLPEQVTEKVFDRMRKVRERLAESARAEGDEEANRITTKAESAKQTILAFADRRAKEIVAKGESEAAQVYDQFAADQDFAIFLRWIESMQQVLGHNTTFILDNESILDFLNRAPDVGGDPQP